VYLNSSYEELCRINNFLKHIYIIQFIQMIKIPQSTIMGHVKVNTCLTEYHIFKIFQILKKHNWVLL